MLLGDLITLVQHKLPVKIVVFNNSALSFVELEIKAAGYLESGTDLVAQNFANIAKAIGIEGFRVENPEDLEEVIKQAFASDEPAIVDIVVNRQELSLPPKISFEQAHGFTLWMLKAVLNHHGNDLIELAKTNLLRRAISLFSLHKDS